MKLKMGLVWKRIQKGECGLKPKYYWLLSDGKTIRELTFEQYSQMASKDYKEDVSSHQYVVIWDSEIYFGKGRHGINIRRKQLDKILGVEE